MSKKMVGIIIGVVVVLTVGTGVAIYGFLEGWFDGISGVSSAQPITASASFDPNSSADTDAFPPINRPAPDGKYNNWISLAKTYQKTYPDDIGLGYIVDAMENFSVEESLSFTSTITLILKNGWKESNPSLEGYLQKQEPIFQSLRKAADTPGTVIPPIQSIQWPIPKMLYLQILSKLMVVDALKQDAAGNKKEAITRVMQGVRVNMIFSNSPGTHVIQYLVGMAGATISLDGMAMILHSSGGTPEQFQAAYEELKAVDDKFISPANPIRSEGKLFLDMAKDLSKEYDSVRKYKDLPGWEWISKASENIPSFESTYRGFWNEIKPELYKPYWEHPGLQIDSTIKAVLTGYQDINTDAIPDYLNTYFRYYNFQAKLRIMEAVCLMKANQPEEAKKIIDPYTGKPLIVMPEKIYSLGPDMLDQGGNQEYDFKKGITSNGDIIFKQ